MANYMLSLTLLCVEDNKTTQVLYKSALEDKVKKLIFADDGLEGFQKFSENKIDIIISDYSMPVLNGIEMIKKIRVLDKEIPIILISAIDEISVVVESLKLGVNNFVSKPVVVTEMYEAINNASKLLLATRYLTAQKNKELELLKQKETYNSYQEDLAFAKELNILRNDFYYQMVDSKSVSLIDFLYQPLDVVSGDAYSARRIDENRTLYLLVDGMGKGLSASLSAMIMTSFINHLVDKMISYDSFSLDILIQESMSYIKPVLLDDEALSLDYIMFDNSYNKLQYAKFAMPVFLLQDKDENIIRIKSNNPPISKWQNNYVLEEYDISNITKFLFYSDGITENSILGSEGTYALHVEEDFKNSFTREELKTKIFKKILVQEDDLTMIFINKLNLMEFMITDKYFESSLNAVQEACEWYKEILLGFYTDQEQLNSPCIIFTELYMNAYEHGNLGMDSFTKHKLIEDDTYLDELLRLEKSCSKKIHVSIYKVQNRSSEYIITKIKDEGAGFDTQILSEIFRNTQSFNGRGVFISRKNSMGIYYNTEGNTVLYLNKI